MTSSLKLHSSWKVHLIEEFEKDYMKNLKKFLFKEYSLKKNIYPPGPLYFSALDKVPFENVRIVILGQDPYHGPQQAHGLSFSVPIGIEPPPSLKNIFKELQRDLNIPKPHHGCLDSWAQQGILLLNSVLTVEQGKPGSHQNQGWEIFTDKIISVLNQKKRSLIFVLWGNYAKKKGAIINRSQHYVLEAAHPSPLSAFNGFFGCGHFSKINSFLKKMNQEEIQWAL